MGSLQNFCRSRLLAGLLFCVLIGVPMSSLYVGYTNYADCPFELFLTQGLITFGYVSIAYSIIVLILVSIIHLFLDILFHTIVHTACILLDHNSML